MHLFFLSKLSRAGSHIDISHKQPPLLFTFLMFTYERWVARGQILGTSREIKILGLRDISGNHTRLYALMRTAMT